MIAIENSIFINRPPQEVFDFASNPANFSKWASETESAEWISEGPPGVGSTYREVDRFLGRNIDSTIEVTIWDPPHQMGVKVVSGPIQGERTVRLESQENGTQLTQTWQGEVGRFFKIAEGLIRKWAEKTADADLGALKLLLEEGQG